MPRTLTRTLVVMLSLGCGSKTPLRVEADAASAPTDVAPVPCVARPSIASVDLLVAIDNSNSMAANQATLGTQFGALIDQLVNPPVDPATGLPRYAAARSVHVGVVSSDLGTPGTLVPSCASSDTGDDGLLNPIRYGLAMREHEPWTSAPAGQRPARCTEDPNQYPPFLVFSASTSDVRAFREDFVCNAYLSTRGCGLEQQLESAYRALVVHNPREQAGNTDPNAGFVRDDAVLGILVVTDEEDGSTRDCRYAEAGVPCTDAISVFDITSPDWSSSSLNLRFYMYTPGSRQDPTWPIDRYVDPLRPLRGFTSLKPGHPERVVFSAIAGVPLQLPTRAGRTDWDALLGRRADGADGYVAMSAEGPVSMRQRNPDPACDHVVPACRREGSAPTSSCDSAVQYRAWPSRRIAQVARRFDDAWGNGAVSSICRNSYGDALDALVRRIQTRLCE